ncbi:armadillo-type protein [Lentinula edodes]|nr:armadillo-type protein [Lentinula edodes]
MSSWNPQPAGLQEILSTIHESTDINKLNSFTRVPDYIAYLAHILTAMPQEEERIRTIAGYLLKNNARLILSSYPEVTQYVKAAVLRAFDDGSPECLSQLVNMLDLSDLDKQEAAFNILQKACEDYPRKPDVEIGGTRPLDFMIPKFLSLAEHPSSKMRSHAVACLSYFVPVNCQSVFLHIDSFIACMFRRASDDDPSVRRHVCQALVLLLAARPEKLMPEMDHVAEYMLYSTKDKNENVALKACEFWLTFAEDLELAPFLQPLLRKLEGDAEDAEIPDKKTDIKPRHYGEETIGSDEDDDYLDDDEFVDEMSTEWNVRKCAAAALDILAVRFTGDLLNVLLAPLKDELCSNHWLQRESGILALAIKPHLPTLVPYLINTLNDLKTLVRSNTCSTLGRYASWTTHPISDEHKQKYFIPRMEGLLRMVLDNNKGVQEARCSAFATLEEDAGIKLAPYLEPVLRNLVFAFNKYQHKNMLMLYNAVGTLTDAVGRELSNPTYVEILMPPLSNRWAKPKDDDIDLIPLLECLASVTIAIGQTFLPYAPPVFERCCSIIHTSLLQYQQFQQNPELDQPDKLFLVVALDLLSGLRQNLLARLETACQVHPMDKANSMIGQ